MPALNEVKQFMQELKDAFTEFASGLSGVEKKRQAIIDKALREAKQKQIEYVRKKIDSLKEIE